MKKATALINYVGRVHGFYRILITVICDHDCATVQLAAATVNIEYSYTVRHITQNSQLYVHSTLGTTPGQAKRLLSK